MKYICANCGYTNKDEEYLDFVASGASGMFTILKTIMYLAAFIGLFFVPVIGWILAIILLFIPINKTKNKNKCPCCGAENCLVPLDSPKGKELLINNFQCIQ